MYCNFEVQCHTLVQGKASVLNVCKGEVVRKLELTGVKKYREEVSSKHHCDGSISAGR